MSYMTRIEGVDTKGLVQEAKDMFENIVCSKYGDYPVYYEWLDFTDDEDIINLIVADNPDISRPEAESIIGEAREIRRKTDKLHSYLDAACSLYHDGTARDILLHLDMASDIEKEIFDNTKGDHMSGAVMTALLRYGRETLSMHL